MRHRHRFTLGERDGLVQRVVCKLSGCKFAYEQGLLFDPSEYET